MSIVKDINIKGAPSFHIPHIIQQHISSKHISYMHTYIMNRDTGTEKKTKTKNKKRDKIRENQQ